MFFLFIFARTSLRVPVAIQPIRTADTCRECIGASGQEKREEADWRKHVRSPTGLHAEDSATAAVTKVLSRTLSVLDDVTKVLSYF